MVTIITASAPTSGAAPTPSGGNATSAGPSNGAYAFALIQRQTRRLGKLQSAVLADTDPESLHQLRVSLRRLRTALTLFTPALQLP
jgi:inorganic triphosphatase YgiF